MNENMKSKMVVVISVGICFGGTLISTSLVDDGIMLKMSEKSDIAMWIPISEIKKIVFPDAKEVSGTELCNIIDITASFNEYYELE